MLWLALAAGWLVAGAVAAPFVGRLLAIAAGAAIAADIDDDDWEGA